MCLRTALSCATVVPHFIWCHILHSYKRYVTIFATAGNENGIGRSPDQFFPCGEKWSGNETRSGHTRLLQELGLHSWKMSPKFFPCFSRKLYWSPPLCSFCFQPPIRSIFLRHCTTSELGTIYTDKLYGVKLEFMFHIVPALIVCNSHKPVFTSTLSSARRPGEETWVWHVTNDVVVSFPDPRTCNHGNETYCPKQNRCAPFRNPRVVKGLDLIYLTFVNMVSHCINNNSFLIEVIEFFFKPWNVCQSFDFFFLFHKHYTCSRRMSILNSLERDMAIDWTTLKRSMYWVVP